MTELKVSEEFQKEAQHALELFRNGSLLFDDHEFALKVPYRVDFEEWISHLEDYLDINPEELEGEKYYQTIKYYFPKVAELRLRDLIANPQSITEDECLEWRRCLYQEGDDADFLILRPLELSSGEVGSAVIVSYSNIPGGEYDLLEVFSSLEEGRLYMNRYSL